tara:strand:+ start:1082 stop:1444 length:363 start_codon:yes stop_codon:yes gene_type:complete
MVKIIPVIIAITLKIFNMFIFLSPEYLNISISLLLKSLMKNNWVVIKKIKGSISKIIEGEFSNDRKIGKPLATSISLKNSNSVNKFKINIKLNIIETTYSKDFKKICVKNFMYIFIFLNF